MPEAIRVSPRVVVPAAALEMRAVRASGPGGQNVNKVASKVELLVDMDQIEGLGDGARRRLLVLARNRQDATGRLRVTSQRSRDQHRNREDCRRRVRDLVTRALRPPTPRRPTRPTAAARERRLESKRRRATRKAARGRVRSHES
jgi:ribosome-associated protein